MPPHSVTRPSYAFASRIVAKVFEIDKSSIISSTLASRIKPIHNKNATTYCSSFATTAKTHRRNDRHNHHRYFEHFHSNNNYLQRCNLIRDTKSRRMMCSSTHGGGFDAGKIAGIDESNGERGKRKKRVLVVGSSGCLGSEVVRYLRDDVKCSVVGFDIAPPPLSIWSSSEAVGNGSGDDRGDFSFLPLSRNALTIGDLSRSMGDKLDDLFATDGVKGYNDEGMGEQRRGQQFFLPSPSLMFDAVICTNGGNVSDGYDRRRRKENDNDYNEDDPSSLYEQMMVANYNPVAATVKVLERYMTRDNGLFVVIGDASALSPTPGMLAYGASKAAVHHLVQSLGISSGTTALGGRRHRTTSDARESLRASPYLHEITAVGVLPSILDTPANRSKKLEASMSSGGNDNNLRWTQPVDIAREVGSWVMNTHLRPHSGSLVKAMTKAARNGDSNRYTTNFYLVR